MVVVEGVVRRLGCGWVVVATSFVVLSTRSPVRRHHVALEMTTTTKYDYDVDVKTSRDQWETGGEWRFPSRQDGPFYSLWKKAFPSIELTDDEPDDSTRKVNYRQYGTAEPRPVAVSKEPTPEVMLERTLAVMDAELDAERRGRYFYGQIVSGEHWTDASLIGGLVYCNDDGKVEHQTLFPMSLMDFDPRNGSPSWEKVFFCGNVVAFVWQHRDYQHQIRIKGFILGDRDRVDATFDLRQSISLHWRLQEFFSRRRTLHRRRRTLALLFNGPRWRPRYDVPRSQVLPVVGGQST